MWSVPKANLMMPNPVLRRLLETANARLEELATATRDDDGPASTSEFSLWHRELQDVLDDEFFGQWSSTRFHSIRFQEVTNPFENFNITEIDSKAETAKRLAVFGRAVRASTELLDDVLEHL